MTNVIMGLGNVILPRHVGMSFRSPCQLSFCTIKFKDLDFKDNIMKLEDDMSELLQHEYDHLDGIVATMRAIDNKSLYLKEYLKENNK